MAISDAVVGNLTTLYLLVIAAIKAYGLAAGRSFSGSCVIVLSTLVVALILIAALTWDVSRKATRALMITTRDRGHEMCRGGICWHGVAVKSPASQWWWRRPSMQGCNPSINMYDRDILEDIRRKLMTFGNDAFDMFREGPFSSFLQFRWEKTASRAFFALLSHEVDVEGTENELWFRVGETNIRFGAREFALMIGLEFGDSGFDPTARHEMPEHSCLSYYGGICPSVNDLHRDFSSSEIVLSNSMEDYVKIANLLFAYQMLACLDGKRAVDVWASVLVEDV